ncbi:hypothetical protein FS842_007482 [Serendipita sp. 407]|nr:hypothetical protein FS842_007482 [Serendipita sp. 407]
MFLTRLTSLFEDTKEKKRTVWLTHKRLTFNEDGDAIQVDSDNKTGEFSCLLRATDGRTITISTHIQPDALPRFHTHYGSLLKTTMTQSLRKRDKKKEKARLEAIVLKKKKMLEGITVVGPKRGNGRRKRDRLEKARQKLEEAKKRMEQKEKKAS